MFQARVCAALAACLLLALLVAACGGGGDSSTTATLTNAQLVKQAKAACTKAKQEQAIGLAAMVKDRPNGGSQPAFVEKVMREVGLPPIEKATEQLATLAESADDQQFDAIVSGLEEALAAAEADPSSIAGGSTDNPFAQVDQQAAKYGLGVCARMA